LRKLIRRTLVPVLVLLMSAAQTIAQDDVRPEFKMPCEQVLKLGLNEFMDVYGEQTGDESTYGMKQGFAYYVDCKRPANDARARPLSEAQRKQVDRVRDELSKLGNAGWNMVYVASGGGTMWGLASVSAYAGREDFMATFIAAMLLPDKKQPAARRRANQSVAKTRRLLAKWSRTPEIEVYGDESKAEREKYYRGLVKEARDAVAQLELLVRALPDAAAERAAKQMAEELSSLEEMG
jgi:hypothetical protein